MNHSLEFVINRVNKQNSLFKDRDWSKAQVINFLEFVGRLSESIEFADGVTVDYAPESEYEYFASEVSVHDGTLAFVLGTALNVVNRITTGNSYYLPVKPKSKKKTYKVGDIIIVDEINKEFAPEGKPWAADRTTVCLPVKVIYDEGDQNEDN